MACSHNERRFNWINYMSGVKRNAFLSDLKREKTHICWNKRRQENMENEVFTPLLEQFMLTPLVCWVSSLISYSDVLSSPINHPMLFFYWLSIVPFSGEDGRTLDGDRWHQIIGIYWISGWDLPEWDNAWDVSSLRHTSRNITHHCINKGYMVKPYPFCVVICMLFGQ